MKDKDSLKMLKKDYDNIKIPKELDDVVNDALNSNIKYRKYQNKMVIAASLLLVVLGINISPAFAQTLSKIPIIGNLVKIITIKNYSIDENGYKASIDVPKISGLTDKKLEYKLNSEFEKEGKKLYEDFLEEMEILKSDKVQGHSLVESWYEVLTDNEDLFSVVVYTHYAQGSSNTIRKFYNIDKKNETVLSLEGMFKNNDYINVISQNIKEQMRDNMKKDKNKHYWIDDEIKEMNFKFIDKNQDFYINKNGELVICFDKYDVAPGYMGLVEFTIPNNIIKPLLNK
ncbi:DUF3298 domain-containing protein [Romboutsia sp. 1001216sp1]|uniref:anti-sigma-V factor rsiV n=1 Tax=Romboutsia TaxID=1501226 RepID=UPI000A3DC23C|nr:MULTISPECIES: anti-sigma-V factor rsiV [Romboutsia]MDB8791336.1 DUF3298 domain-containing protein [Romboutsia sp. 1001216sp1]MDB8793750.1 DUF3298 domain-containing protein [Romboutsia sp. 1001216sp1]MDB8795147.1 DUF3298 domain-containing protein [Romboutsia sp. 1001216sp1]MDB8798957.1 DUF3298 domain-containing protein [Romboutsia sp. 1001216sp1]MDB8801762.1 DUF3298 domain-containing protein [Romboutsia sp. 1001216sp1]